MSATTARNDMLTQVVKSIRFMKEKIEKDPKAEYRAELKRLQKLHDELHWYNSEW